MYNSILCLEPADFRRDHTLHDFAGDFSTDAILTRRTLTLTSCVAHALENPF